MPVLVPNLAAPHKVVYIPFGSTATAAGTSSANGAYRMWVTDAPSEILAVTLVRQTGVATCTYKAGFVAAATAPGALTELSTAAATTDTTAPGLLNLPVDSDPLDSTKGLTVPASTCIGFTAGGTVGVATCQGVIIKYRST